MLSHDDLIIALFKKTELATVHLSPVDRPDQDNFMEWKFHQAIFSKEEWDSINNKCNTKSWFRHSRNIKSAKGSNDITFTGLIRYMPKGKKYWNRVLHTYNTWYQTPSEGTVGRDLYGNHDDTLDAFRHVVTNNTDGVYQPKYTINPCAEILFKEPVICPLMEETMTTFTEKLIINSATIFEFDLNEPNDADAVERAIMACMTEMKQYQDRIDEIVNTAERADMVAPLAVTNNLDSKISNLATIIAKLGNLMLK